MYFVEKFKKTKFEEYFQCDRENNKSACKIMRVWTRNNKNLKNLRKILLESQCKINIFQKVWSIISGIPASPKVNNPAREQQFSRTISRFGGYSCVPPSRGATNHTGKTFDSFATISSGRGFELFRLLVGPVRPSIFWVEMGKLEHSRAEFETLWEELTERNIWTNQEIQKGTNLILTFHPQNSLQIMKSKLQKFRAK